MYQDKSVALGLDPSLPVGSWFIGCHCENDAVWEKVKQGTYHGFSIEAIVGVEEFEKQVEELNSNNDMENTNEEMFLQKLRNVLKEFFTSKKDEPVEEQVTEEVALEEQPVNEPAQPVETPSEPQTEPEPTPVQEEPKNEPVEPVNEPQEAPKVDNSKLEELIGNLKAEIEALKQSNDGLQERIKEMGNQPSVQPVNVNAKPSAGDNYSQWRETMAQLIR